FESALSAARAAAALVVIGTSGATTLPNLMCDEVASRGAPLVVIDPGETPFTALARRSAAGVVLRGSAVALAAPLALAPRRPRRPRPFPRPAEGFTQLYGEAIDPQRAAVILGAWARTPRNDKETGPWKRSCKRTTTVSTFGPRAVPGACPGSWPRWPSRR